MPPKNNRAAQAAPDDQGVQESAQQIWLAGLGAFAKAQQQGSQVFDALVQDGLALQRKTQEVARTQMAEASEKLSSLASGLGARVSPPWDRLEGIFEERVGRALHRLGVASQEELVQLRERVDALQAQLQQLSERPAPTGRTRARGSTPPRAKAAVTRRPSKG